MMKKLVSLFLTATMLFMLSIPTFAVKAAKFSLRAVSETDSEIVVSINYDGGSTFNCIDFEIVYNDKKLKATEAYDGDGLEAFIRDLKKQGGAGASAINKDGNPIKGSMAVTSMFKTVSGNDLFVLKFKKLTKDKVTADDVEVVFTNCASETEKVQASITNQLSGNGSNAASTSKPSESKSNAVTSATKKPGESSKADTTAASEKGETKSTSNEQTSVGDTELNIQNTTGFVAEESENSVQKPERTKKTIGISAAIICFVLIVIAVAVYISKKKEK